MNKTHFLNGFLYPKSVAFYGANNKGASLASIQIMNLIKSRYIGKIFPIHLESGSVMGFKAYKNIAEVPEIPDLVVIVLPAEVIPQIFKWHYYYFDKILAKWVRLNRKKLVLEIFKLEILSKLA